MSPVKCLKWPPFLLASVATSVHNLIYELWLVWLFQSMSLGLMRTEWLNTYGAVTEEGEFGIRRGDIASRRSPDTISCRLSFSDFDTDVGFLVILSITTNRVLHEPNQTLSLSVRSDCMSIVDFPNDMIRLDTNKGLSMGVPLFLWYVSNETL